MNDLRSNIITRFLSLLLSMLLLVQGSVLMVLVATLFCELRDAEFPEYFAERIDLTCTADQCLLHDLLPDSLPDSQQSGPEEERESHDAKHAPLIADHNVAAEHNNYATWHDCIFSPAFCTVCTPPPEIG